jgi:tRNA-dihydrouridine synthase B
MRIGPHTVEPALILAPMAGVTDKPFRLLCKTLGAGYAVSEMTTSDARLWRTRKSVHRMDHAGEPSPIGVQIAGADPGALADAARHNVDNGAQIVDINMGCPAKKVCSAWAGSALLQDELLVARILRAVVAAVNVPVTLKIRTGWHRDHKNGVAIARIAEDAGVRALAVHGRTRDMLYAGEAEYDTIAAIKQAVSIPVIANGDVDSPAKAREVLERTGADALMIGRAAQGRPWIFREIAHYLATGQKLPPPSAREVRDVLLGHVAALHEFYGEPAGVRIARKHLGWYAKDRPENAAFRDVVNRAESAVEQLARARLLRRARSAHRVQRRGVAEDARRRVPRRCAFPGSRRAGLRGQRAGAPGCIRSTLGAHLNRVPAGTSRRRFDERGRKWKTKFSWCRSLRSSPLRSCSACSSTSASARGSSISARCGVRSRRGKCLRPSSSSGSANPACASIAICGSAWFPSGSASASAASAF